METAKQKRGNIYLYAFLALAVLAGLYFRMKGLGKWPLSVDEYYIIASVKNILKHGLPQFAGGGYYDRGLIYQYTISLLLLLGVKGEFAGRIITVITNLLTLIPLYLITKKVSGKFLGAVLVFVFCFSVWEVEFARFARMYSPFQMVFVWYIYFLLKFLIDNDKRTLKWLLILSTLSVFLYEGSIFLTGLNFIPLFWNPENKHFEMALFKGKGPKLSYVVLTIVILILGYAFLSTNFRTLGASAHDLLPANVTLNENMPTGRFRTAPILMLTLFRFKLFSILFMLPLFITVFLINKLFKNNEINPSAKWAFLFIILLSILNLFGLVVLFFIIFYFIDWIKKKDIKQLITLVMPLIILFFVFWTVFALRTDLWYHYFPNEVFTGTLSKIKILWKEWLNYPYFYETFVLFRETIPHTTYVMVFFLFSGTIYLLFNKNEKNFGARVLFSLILLLLFLVDVLTLLYFQTRYFFFMYPLILIAAFLSLLNITTSLIKNSKISIALFCSITIAAVLFSEDFSLKHLINIDSEKVNYRENISHNLVQHYYPRWDTRTPAEFINKRFKPNDIIVINQQVDDYYLKRLDYVYYNSRRPDFPGISIDHGRKERWTNAPLLYDTSQFMKILASKDETKWLIIDTYFENKDLDSINFFNEYNKYKVYTGQDGVELVYKIPPKPVVDKIDERGSRKVH